MLQPRLLGASAMAREPSMSTLVAAINTLSLCPKHSHLRPQLPTIFTRNASHAAQGRANGPKDSAGRRLGAKKTASEYVIPGNIIFRQRGTKWFPGENVSMGKDHTIYATEYGYVRYYKNPTLHEKRRYIGVALEKEGPGSMLPTPANAPTRRRLGMYTAPIRELNDAEFLSAHLSSNSKGDLNGSGDAGNFVPVATAAATGMVKPTSARSRAAPWPSNYEIGKAMEKNAHKVRDFDRKDRWGAWRKRAKKVKEKMLTRATKATRKTKGKKVVRGPPAAKR